MEGYAYRFLEKWFGGPVRILPSNPTVGTASAPLVGNNPDRVALTIVNLGASNVWIAPDAAGAVSSIKGMFLPPNGGSVSMQVDADGPLPAYGWNAIAAVAAEQMFVIEVIGGP